METTLLYQTQPGIIWDWRVAWDLSLGGLGVGAFLLAFSLWCLADRRYRPLAQTAAVIAPIAVAIGLTLLFSKLGYKFHVYQMGLNLAPTSIMWWGALIQGAFVALSAIFAFRLLFPDVSLLAWLSARLVGWVAVPLAVLTGLYHGVLLAVISSHPLWATGQMVMASVLLFMVTGVAGTLLVHMIRTAIFGARLDEGPFRDYRQGLRPLSLIMLVSTALLLVSLLAWWMELRFGPASDQQALADALTSYGTLIALAIVSLIVALALCVASLLADLRGRYFPAFATALLCVLMLGGGFAIRFAAVLGGQMGSSISTLATLS
ncbi:NrfD/PsrC family molybdoenzyme membrane anchor subunit [Halomonas daqiaonensis]|uniref:Formate-dependent nitrite reductase, membrane component NrfD n=1 Tax=Halomonas daqiaonensis TaxID=650850 RepID=A0A1H7S9X5_9GAMM|nr:NrfD/PsrC family molybdoenzyme membrane anchor subunit [Halomonas daqiaonensis]SEL69420.1 Formate-dependent nitrite reductase, membrane component NrfD [Halomonas daqiaonensis]